METLQARCDACPSELSPQQVERFQRDGYLAFTDVLSGEEVATAKAELSRLARELGSQNKQVIHNSYGQNWKMPGSPFMIQFERGQEPESADDPDFDLKIRKLFWFADQSPFMAYLCREHPRLMGVLQGLVGRDPILFQDMALVKPPFIGTPKPWHQDNAYFSVAPLELVCGVWIALDEATVENGCMQVLKGGHKLGALKHHHTHDCEIVPERVRDKDATAVPLPPGGALFFYGMLPHFTPHNSSADRRRALQFHYRGQASQIVDKEEYDRLYAERDGTPASCRAAAPKR